MAPHNRNVYVISSDLLKRHHHRSNRASLLFRESRNPKYIQPFYYSTLEDWNQLRRHQSLVPKL